jgi:hypothetical protein
MKLLLALLTVSIFTFGVSAQETDLTGNLNFDSKLAFEQTYQSSNDEQNLITADKRTPLLAAGLSFVLPGAGQFYNDEIWKSAIFIAVEAAAIFTAASYDKKGDDRTSEFEAFANSHWDAARYAKWTITNLNSLNSGLNPSDYNNLFSDAEMTRVNWLVLNRLEGDIGDYYSHRLAPFDDQQYYEMIGKYSQFNPGWDDFGDENTAFSYGEPVTQKFSYYSGVRAEANDFYTVSKTAVIIVVTNHVLSALEAAWSSHRYNKSLELNVSLDKEQIGYRTEYIPKLNMKYRINL